MIIRVRVLTLKWSGWGSEEPDIPQTLGTSVFRKLRILSIKHPAGMKTASYPHLQNLELLHYELDPDNTNVALSRLIGSRLGTSDPETISRCIRRERPIMVVVKPSLNVQVTLILRLLI